MRRLAMFVIASWIALGSDTLYARTGGETPASVKRARGGLLLVREMSQPPGPTGFSFDPITHFPVRSVFTLWYQDAKHWRVQGRYVVRPRDPMLVRDGSLATPFYPFPGTVIQRGNFITHYNQAKHVVIRVRASSDGMDPLVGNASLYLNRSGAGTLTTLLTRLRRCRSAVVRGIRKIAGRSASVVAIGSDRCNRTSAAGSLNTGGEQAWLDTQTLVLLRIDRFAPGTRRLLVSTVARQVKYDAHFSSRVFNSP